MDLLTLRAAAGGGSVDGQPAAALVAAGFTLLQRCPALVRAVAGQRAALLLPTSPQFLTALAACEGRGAVLVNPLASAAEIAHQLTDAAVGAALTVSAMQHKLPPSLPRVLLDEAPTQALFLAGADDPAATPVDLGSHFGLDLEGDADASGRDEECAVVYTSAMRGRPLGAVLTHRNLITNARQTLQAASQSPDDHLLALLPFSHLFGLTVSLMAPLFAGARVTTMPRFKAITAVDVIERDGITEIVGVPAVFAGMLAALERRGGGLRAPALRLCICGGAPLPAALQQRWLAATGVELRQGYGLTEASPVAIFSALQHENVHGVLGLPFPGVQVSIRDPNSSAECAVGAPGEICIAGDTVFRGYVGEVGPPGSLRPVPASTRAASDGLRTVNGWLHTGDRGLQRPDGRVEFLGLLKPMFTRNGFNIYPAELERVVGELPGVRRVRAYAIPDPVREDDIGLEVVAEDAAVTEITVKAWCETQLAQYKQPSRVEIRRGVA